MRKITLLSSVLGLLTVGTAMASIHDLKRSGDLGKGMLRPQKDPALVKAMENRHAKDNGFFYTPMAGKFYYPNYATPADTKASKVALSDGAVLYGSVIWDASWSASGEGLGMYSFAIPSSYPEKIGTGVNAMGGGAYANGKYYCFDYSQEDGTLISNKLYVYDAKTWKVERQEELLDSEVGATFALSMAYNPVDGQFYGSFVDADAESCDLATFNFETMTKTVIQPLQSTYYYVLAFDRTGQLYGIGGNGHLYKIDCKTGDAEDKGNTGLRPEFVQDGTFDYTTNEFYWFYMSDNYSLSGIYSVDITNAAVTKLVSWGSGNRQVTGVFSMSSNCDADAPSSVTNLKATFVDGAYDGVVTFDLPSTTFSTSQPLVGEVSYEVQLDGAVEAKGTGVPGQHVSLPISTVKGNHKVRVTAYNEAGQGAAVECVFYVGYDVPKKVLGISASLQDDGTVALSWWPVTEGLSSGYFDASKVTYNVVRKPDGVVVAQGIAETSVIDSNPVTSLNDYRYEVVALFGSEKSEPNYSGFVTMGDVVIPPYSRNFTDGNDLGLFTVIDANNDGCKWIYDSSAKIVYYQYSKTNQADDWLVSPQISLKKGAKYKFIVELNGSPSFPETFEVKYGTEATPEGMNKTLIRATDNSSKQVRAYEAWVTPDADGIYYIGVHCISKADRFRLYITSFSLGAAVSTAGPAAVADAEVVPGDKGALSATVKFTTPSLTMAGDALTEITKATVMNVTTQTIVGSIDNPAIATAYSFVDDNAVKGHNTYSIICSNSFGDGTDTRLTRYIGEDIPCAPTNFIFRQEGESAILTWDAPSSVGVNGGWVDVDHMTYTIYIQDPISALVAQGIKECTVVHEDVPITKQQEPVYYGMCAVTPAGRSDYAVSNYMAFGSPYVLPFVEGFPEKSADSSPWISDPIQESEENTSWGIKDVSAQGRRDANNDGGMLVFSSYGEGNYRVISPLISLEGSEHPILKFLAYDDTPTASLYVEISTDCEHWTTIAEVPEVKKAGEWTEVTIDMTPYMSLDYLALGFRGEATRASNDILLDLIRLGEEHQRDLSLRQFTVPEKVQAGHDIPMSVTVANEGSVVATDYSIGIYSGSALLTTIAGEPLAAGAVKTYDFTLPTKLQNASLVYIAKIIYSEDENTDNNDGYAFVDVELMHGPVIGDLTGVKTDDGKFQLSWSAPDLTYTVAEVTESFEDFESWSIGGVDCETDVYGYPTKTNNDRGAFADFELIDNDHVGTYSLDGLGDYPNMNSAMAATIFDCVEPNDLTGMFLGHTGTKMVCFWASVYGMNDDYLVLPELAAGHKKISFWAKGINPQYDESFEIVVSTTDTKISSFISFHKVASVPTSEISAPENGYTYYEYTLPVDVKYVAIHYISQDQFGLLVDDITYTPANARETFDLVGYNMYRNGEKLNTAVLTEPSMETEFVSGASYNVSVVYKQGESGLSNTVVAGETALGQVTLASQISVVGHTIFAPAGSSLYMSDGSLVAAHNADGAFENVAPGIYVVKSQEQRSVVIVK